MVTGLSEREKDDIEGWCEMVEEQDKKEIGKEEATPIKWGWMDMERLRVRGQEGECDSRRGYGQEGSRGGRTVRGEEEESKRGAEGFWSRIRGRPSFRMDSICLSEGERYEKGTDESQPEFSPGNDKGRTVGETSLLWAICVGASRPMSDPTDQEQFGTHPCW